MTDCQKASAIDLAVVLTDPHDPAWQEFRAHYPSCPVCRVEVSHWTRLESLLRSEPSEEDEHPPVEQLLQFQNQPEQLDEQLSEKDRQALRLHVQTCAACREEMAQVAAFDATRIEHWAAQAKQEIQSEHVYERQAPAELWARFFKRLNSGLRALLFHPAFAYSLVALLSIRVFVTPPSSNDPSNIDPARSIPTQAATAPVSIAPPFTLSAAETAGLVLNVYQAALATQDMRQLEKVWQLDTVWYGYIAELFSQSQRLSVLIDIQSVTANSDGTRLAVVFAQATTVLNNEGRFYTKGPDAYSADIVWQENSWVIHNLHNLHPLQSGPDSQSEG